MSVPVAAVDQATRHAEFAVHGMTCASCAARIERKLNKLDGVRATVNYATARASVHLPAELPDSVVLDAVTAAGYAAVPRVAGASAAGQDAGGLPRRLAVAALLAVPLCDLSLVPAFAPALRFPHWQLVCVLLAIPVVAWCALPFHRAAAQALRHGGFTMDTLVSLGVLVCFGWACWGVFADGGAQTSYLDVSAGIVVFQLAGRYVERRSRRTATDLLGALDALAAKDVRVLRAGADGVEEEVALPVGDLRVGDRFVVRPGEKVATDGTVTTGVSTVDVSAITGEPVPVEVADGDRVVGGGVNRAGRLVVTATAVGAHTQLAQMTALAERATERKAAVERLVDRVCAVFVPAVLIAAALTLAGWLVLGGTTLDAIGAAVSVLIVACPCALGLATPTALMVGIGHGARLGILLKGAHVLEASKAIDTVVLDKTGTVTEGRMTLTGVHPCGSWTGDEVLSFVAAVEAASEHPIAAAVVTHARARLAALPEVAEFTALPGIGARGVVEGRTVLVGKPELLSEHGVALTAELTDRVAALAADGATTVVVAVDGMPAGVLAVRDEIKPSAAAAVADLHRLGLRTLLLTGDNTATAAAVAAATGIQEVRAGVLPAAKAETIAELRAAGHAVAMVGDGVNDAPALATADLGMAVATGTDIALRSADVVLVRESLSVVPDAIRLAHRTLRTIRVNLVWAFGYNVVALPIAAAGLLNPLIAAAAMSASSLLVVSNSLRLNSKGRP